MQLHTSDTGSGSAVLLLHGCPSTTSGFAPLVAALSSGFRVLVPALPGYGDSPALDGEYSLSRVQELLEDELLARGIEQLSVLGFSGGAYRALALALDSKRLRVTRLALVGGVAGLDEDVRGRYRQLAGMARGGFDFRPLWLELMGAPGFAQRFPQHVSEVLAWIAAAPAQVLAQELEAFADSPDLRPRLAELRIPVVVRVGELDQAAPVAWSRAITDRVLGSELQVVPECGHALFYEDCAATTEAMRRALAGV